MKVEYIRTLKVGPKTIAHVVTFLLSAACMVWGASTIYSGIVHEVRENSASQKGTAQRVDKLVEKVDTLVLSDVARSEADKATAEKIDDVRKQQQYLINLLLNEKVVAQTGRAVATPAADRASF